MKNKTLINKYFETADDVRLLDLDPDKYQKVYKLVRSFINVHQLPAIDRIGLHSGFATRYSLEHHATILLLPYPLSLLYSDAALEIWTVMAAEACAHPESWDVTATEKLNKRFSESQLNNWFEFDRGAAEAWKEIVNKPASFSSGDAVTMFLTSVGPGVFGTPQNFPLLFNSLASEIPMANAILKAWYLDAVKAS